MGGVDGARTKRLENQYGKALGVFMNDFNYTNVLQKSWRDPLNFIISPLK
jgi:hypothetical protein